MEFEQLTKQIQRKLYENGINTETQDYILEYVYLNQKLFGDFLDIDKLVNRIINNLKYNIKGIEKNRNPIKNFKIMTREMGRWTPKENTIFINPIIKIISSVSKRNKKRQDSTIRHELDHCATTKFVQIDEKEKEDYIEYYIRNNNIDNIEEQLIVRRDMDEIFGDGNIPIVGINDLRYEIKNNIFLKRLNEGITAYKQEMYDKFLGNESHTGYKIDKKVAKFIGEVIGEKELIQNHFNNDYESIRTAFHDRTGQDLNLLIEELNKEPNHIAKMFLGKIYTNKFNKNKNKRIYKFIEETSINNKQQKRNRNVDFVPKYDIDYEKAKNKLQSERQLEEPVGDKKIEKEENTI